MAIRKVEGYTLLFLEICIIFLNVLAIIVIFRFKKKYNPDILIFSLAVADLLKAFIPLNMTLAAYLADNGAMVQSSNPCKIFGWTAFTLNSGIMLVMTVMAIDRYIAMCWPFRYKDLLSKKRLIYTIIGAFVFSGIHSALPLVGIGRIQSYNNGSFCHFDFDSTKPLNMGYSIFVLVLGISMLLVVIFCYTRAMLSVRGLIKRQRRMSTPTRDIDGSEQKRQAMNRMFARLMIVMMMAFCLSWLLLLLVILQHVSGWFELPPDAHFWSMRLAVVNSVLNPLIGAAMCKPYRKGYLFILCKLVHCCSLCSTCQAVDDPWTTSRRLSLSWRNSWEKDTTTPTPNLKKDPSFSCHDSGIVPDSSIGYHQGGVINATCEMSANQAGGIHNIARVDGTRIRPRLERKRISFKDEVEANQAGLSRGGQQATTNEGCTSDVPTGPYYSSAPKPQELPINRQEKTDVPLGGTNMEQDSSAEKETAPLLIENPLITDRPPPLGIEHGTEIISKAPIEKSETKLNEMGKGVPDNRRQCQSPPSKDDNCKTTQERQIAHFPADVDSSTEPGATTVQNTAHRFSPSLLTSISVHERTDLTPFHGVKPHSKSFTYDCQVTDKSKDSCLSENKAQGKQAKAVTVKQALDTGPGATNSSFHRTKSCELALRKNAHRPSFQKQSRLMKAERLEGAEGTSRSSESHSTRSLPEMVMNSLNETQNTGDSKKLAPGEKRHSFDSITPHGEIENSSQRQASDPQIAHSACEIHRKMSELSQKELEREVFC